MAADISLQPGVTSLCFTRMLAVCLNNPQHQQPSYVPISPNLLYNKIVSPFSYQNRETL
jgi:hypothetical protein